jgi:hypothetical protein
MLGEQLREGGSDVLEISPESSSASEGRMPTSEMKSSSSSPVREQWSGTSCRPRTENPASDG